MNKDFESSATQRAQKQ